MSFDPNAHTEALRKIYQQGWNESIEEAIRFIDPENYHRTPPSERHVVIIDGITNNPVVQVCQNVIGTIVTALDNMKLEDGSQHDVPKEPEYNIEWRSGFPIIMPKETAGE